MAFKVAVADALANQGGKQLVQRLQLSFRGVAAVLIRRKTFNDVRAGQVLGDQIRLATQPQKAGFQQRQRLGRGDAEKQQPIAFLP